VGKVGAMRGSQKRKVGAMRGSQNKKVGAMRGSHNRKAQCSLHTSSYLSITDELMGFPSLPTHLNSSCASKISGIPAQISLGAKLRYLHI
jgi:hypothetical protein